jgi:ABC-type transport system substrate-binding protein
LARVAGALSATVAVAACSAAPPAPSPATSQPTAAQPTSAPAAKTEAAKPAVAPPLADTGQGQSATQKVIMSLVAPGRESNDVRLDGNLDVWQHKPMYEYLIGYDPQTGKYVPQLATEWSLEPDQLSFRMKLQKGVQFHKNMGEFTARDVLFTWQEMKREDTLNGWVPWYQNTLKDIEVVNDHEVIFRLNRQDSNFVNILSEADAGFEIRSKAHADAMGPPTMEGQPYAGTGPYQFKERAQAQYIRYERVPYQHWRIQAGFPELEYRFQREASTRLAGLLAGENHLAQLPQDLMVEAEKKGFSTISSSLPGLRVFMQMYCCQVADPADPSKGYLATGSPLLDARVRKALNKAINRDELNKSLLAGKGDRMMIQAHHPSRPGWDPGWEQRWPELYGYDPAAARALLTEAGYGPGKPMSTNILVEPLASIPAAEDILESIAGYWRAVGAQPELLQVDPTEIRNASRQRKYQNHFSMRSSNGAMYTTINGFFLIGGSRSSYFEDFDLDTAVNAAVSTYDEKKQDEAWRQAGEVMFARQSHIPLFWLPAQIMANPKIVSQYVFPGNVSGTWSHAYTLR